MDAAARRPDPIPVYAEMSSVNPVFVLPGAAADPKWSAILAGSVLGSARQLCTKPGLIFVPDTEDQPAAGRRHRRGNRRLRAAHHADRGHGPGPRRLALPRRGDQGRRRRVGPRPAAERKANPFAVQIEADRLEGELAEDSSGRPRSWSSQNPDSTRADGRARRSAHHDDPGRRVRPRGRRRTAPALAGEAGRIVWNNVPTGVAVVEAMQHGGPWPATSASWSTSVGTEAVRRFVRPVALQGVPEELIA